MRLCIVAVGGDDPGITRGALGPEQQLTDALVIAADSGVRHLRSLGLVPAVVVGDLDSATTDDLDWAVEHGAEVIAHPPDKDETDFDLAMQRAVADDDVTEVAVVGMFGGRVDHFLANLAVVASPRFRSVPVRAVDATATLWVMHASADARPRRFVLPVNAGTTLSLLAWGGDAVVSTTGLRWNVNEERFPWDGSVGVSNEVLTAEPSVTVSSGVLLAVVAKSEPASVPTTE